MSEDGVGAYDSEFEPRARIVDREGNVTPVRREHITGLDEFAETWERNTYLPHHLVFSGWQMFDEMHPAGEGRPGYRLVHKTIRTFAFPLVSITHPNLQIKFTNGPVTWGEPRYAGTLRARTAGAHILPEWGTVDISGPEYTYRWEPNIKVQMEAHQETTPDANYLEILYVLPDGEWGSYEGMIAAGRAAVAPLTMMLDLMYGERVVGPVLTEEVGELFEDWHWNRLIGGRTVAMESQAALEMIDGNIFASRLAGGIERHLAFESEERNRVRVASQWYWRADSESDPVHQYVAYWLCIEAVELGQNGKISTIKDAVASALGVGRSEVGEADGAHRNSPGVLVESPHPVRCSG